MTATVSQWVEHNRAAHDRVATTYEHTHIEIFNPTEQARLADAIARAVQAVQTGAQPVAALDFGAGTGNLTGCLRRAGTTVTAADVSPKMLREVARKYPGTATLLLNGVDLSNVQSQSFDVVAMYSVLHHIVDYLAALRECVRVLAPGGVLYIDHEVNPAYWSPSTAYRAYQAELAAAFPRPKHEAVVRTARNLLSPTAWRRLIDRKVRGIAPLEIEGDVHVSPEDHIEWDQIDAVLRERCDLIATDDYLVCREPDPSAPIHRRYASRCTDMRARTYRVR